MVTGHFFGDIGRSGQVSVAQVLAGTTIAAARAPGASGLDRRPAEPALHPTGPAGRIVDGAGNVKNPARQNGPVNRSRTPTELQSRPDAHSASGPATDPVGAQPASRAGASARLASTPKARRPAAGMWT